MADFHGGGGMAAQDFEEEEVWAMMNAREGSNSNPKTRKDLSTSSSSSWRFTTTSRSIPPRSATSSGVHHSSAPLKIPDWSKILKKKPKNKNTWDDNDDGGSERNLDGEGEEDDGGGYDEMLPPHEYLARRLATTQIASFSMCEGIGRTLKGRDLTNLRKAILTKTGFLE